MPVMTSPDVFQSTKGAVFPYRQLLSSNPGKGAVFPYRQLLSSNPGLLALPDYLTGLKDILLPRFKQERRFLRIIYDLLSRTIIWASSARMLSRVFHTTRIVMGRYKCNQLNSTNDHDCHIVDFKVNSIYKYINSNLIQILECPQ